MSGTSSWLRKPLFTGVLVVGLAAVAVGLYLFQPWKLWTDEKVDEALPGAAAAEKAGGPPEEPDGPTTLASGEFITHEHETTGSAKVIQLQDGSRVLRLQDLNTSNGPALKVWITDAKVKPGTAGWHVFDDGAHLSLGGLKGNQGSQNYRLPAGADLDEYSSVTIWCDRFDVSFGAAGLSRA